MGAGRPAWAGRPRGLHGARIASTRKGERPHQSEENRAERRRRVGVGPTRRSATGVRRTKLSGKLSCPGATERSCGADICTTAERTGNEPTGVASFWFFPGKTNQTERVWNEPSGVGSGPVRVRRSEAAAARVCRADAAERPGGERSTGAGAVQSRRRRSELAPRASFVRGRGATKGADDGPERTTLGFFPGKRTDRSRLFSGGGALSFRGDNGGPGFRTRSGDSRAVVHVPGSLSLYTVEDK